MHITLLPDVVGLPGPNGFLANRSGDNGELVPLLPRPLGYSTAHWVRAHWERVTAKAAATIKHHRESIPIPPPPITNMQPVTSRRTNPDVFPQLRAINRHTGDLVRVTDQVHYDDLARTNLYIFKRVRPVAQEDAQ